MKYEKITVQLRNYYGSITDGSYGVLHHFLRLRLRRNTLRYATLTFFGPYRYVRSYKSKQARIIKIK